MDAQTPRLSHEADKSSQIALLHSLLAQLPQPNRLRGLFFGTEGGSTLEGVKRV